jgi:hypothetical protein
MSSSFALALRHGANCRRSGAERKGEKGALRFDGVATALAVRDRILALCFKSLDFCRG